MIKKGIWGKFIYQRNEVTSACSPCTQGKIKEMQKGMDWKNKESTKGDTEEYLVGFRSLEEVKRNGY